MAMISNWKHILTRVNYSLTNTGCVWMLDDNCSFLGGSTVIIAEPENFLPEGLGWALALESLQASS